MLGCVERTIFGVCLLSCLVAVPALRGDVILTFDDLSPGDIVDDQYVGLGADFGGTAKVLAPLGGFDPTSSPHVGFNSDSSTAEIRVDAVGPLWQLVGAYIEVSAQDVFFAAYDLHGTELGSHVITTNYLSSGPEFRQITAPNIAYAVFRGAVDADNFTIDDFRFRQVIPAPGAALLLLCGCGCVGWIRRWLA